MKRLPIIIIIIFVLMVGVFIWHQAASSKLIATVTYSCDALKTIEAKFYRGKDVPGTENTPPIPAGSVKVSLDRGTEMTLYQTLSADGARYANDDESFVFWSKGDSALIMRNNKMDLTYTNCQESVDQSNIQDENGDDGTGSTEETGSTGDIVPSIVQGIRGVTSLGPTCPVMREPPDPQCADKPYKTSLAITTPDGARVIKTVLTDGSGAFSVDLQPGSYAIRSAAAANILPYCSSQGTIVVKQRIYTDTTVYCDTGIR